MILTLTANPSIDRTMSIGGPLRRGEVQRTGEVIDQAGGKGLNVARVVALAGQPTIAVLPADSTDPVIEALHGSGVLPVNVSVGRRTRTNITIAEPDGTTTKLNAPGTPLSALQVDALTELMLTHSTPRSWVVFAGSLPPGVAPGWYAELVQRLGSVGRRVAVDTSGEPLRALLTVDRRPDLIKPNAFEVALLTGDDPFELEADPARAVTAAHRLTQQGFHQVLLTLGGSGAVLVDAQHAWQATAPTVQVKSTVGAGDSALAGYLIAEAAGEPPERRLQYAVAYGSAAAALPGTTMPTPADVDLDGVAVSPYALPTQLA